MGIESTHNINREVALTRIKEIIVLIENADWVELNKKVENEDNHYIENFVNEFNNIHKEFLENNKIFKDISNWPNNYLEIFMDKPCVRFSQFENYTIIV